MLKSYNKDINEIAFLYAYCGQSLSNGNKIYSISAKILSKDGKIKKLDSLINYPHLTQRERYYSNISSQMLKDAPSTHDVIGKLKLFLSNCDVIVIFDNHNNLDHIKHHFPDKRFIDLCFALEFFLPHVQSYSPKSIWEFLCNKTRAQISFSASEVVDLSYNLTKYICENVLNDQLNPNALALRYYLIKSETLFAKIFIHLTKNVKFYFASIFDSYTTNDTPNWKKFLEKAKKPPEKKDEMKQGRPISFETLEYAYQGVCNAKKSYKYRRQQQDFMAHVATALNENAILTLEAGTGTGKTLGYLLPVFEFLRKNPDKPVIISTYTKSLQKQIFNQEIVAAKELFSIYKDIKVSLLKGKSSYVCVHKLDSLYDDSLSQKDIILWLYFVNMIYHFRDTDIDFIGAKIKKNLTSKSQFNLFCNEISAKDGCTPKHTSCPAQIVATNALFSQIIITNHHKLALIDHDQLLSGNFRHFVIDEANHFENAIRSAYSIEINSWELTEKIKYIKTAVNKIIKKASFEIAEKLAKAMDAINNLYDGIYELQMILKEINQKKSTSDLNVLIYDHTSFDNGHINNHLEKLEISLENFQENLEPLKENTMARMLKIQARTHNRLKNNLKQIKEIIGTIKLFKQFVSYDNKVSSYQCFGKHWVLSIQEVNVDRLIVDNIFAKKDTVIFTAATLTYKGSFENFSNITGISSSSMDIDNPKKIFFEKIASPFLQDAVEILVPKNSVNGKFANKQVWMKTLVETLPELITKNKGRTLILFSSYLDLKNTVSMLKDFLKNTEYPFLIQEPGCSTANLCEEFMAIKESILFGVDTFWYGVDFKGDTLTQVIITRIPYPSPADPIHSARKKILPANEYWKRYNYDTYIKMKQGLGRLIRCETDKGKVFILDSRYKNDKYI